MSGAHTRRVTGRLVEIELLPLIDLADARAVADAGRYASASLDLAGPHVKAALVLAVFGLDLVTVLRHGRPFSALRRQRAISWWGTLRGLPGFAQLRQLLRTPAMLLFSERIHIDRDTRR